MAVVRVRPTDGSVDKDRSQKNDSWVKIMVLTLRASRLMGLAPVLIHRKPVHGSTQRYPFSVSTGLRLYSYLILIILHLCSLIALIIDFNTEMERSVRTRSKTASCAIIAEIVPMYVITTVGVLGAGKRWETTIQYLNCIEEINLRLETIPRKYTGRMSYIATALYIYCIFGIHAVDFWTFLYEALYEGKDYIVLSLYISFYVELTMLGLLEMQFMWVALFTESTLNSVNEAFEQLIYDIDLKERKNIFTVINGYDAKFQKADRFLGKEKSTKLIDKFRRLTLLYGATCDVIAGLNDCFGATLIPFIVSFVIQLVVTPFYFVARLKSKNVKALDLILQTLFCIYHFISMLMVVEPGHWTEKQADRLQVLTSKLVRKSIISSEENLALEIAMFLKQIQLTKAVYTPMNMCTLSRPLIFKIMGAVTTYLVIVLQFQQMDNNNW